MGRFVRGMLLILVAAVAAGAQENAAATAERQIETLRVQLRELASKEAELQARLRQLDEDLRPENIERSVALIGTTDASALRDQRRQQLERQKAGVEEQMASLATSRGRLEAAIASAEAAGVRLRAAAVAPDANDAARPPAVENTAVTPAAPAVQKRQNAQRQRQRVRRGGRSRRRPE